MDFVFNFLDNGYGLAGIICRVSRRQAIGIRGIGMNIEQAKTEEIIAIIKQVHYGEVVITIHDSEIVQVEKREKKRFRIQKRLHAQS